MIDVWLIFSLMIPFAQVLLHTAADMLRIAHRTHLEKKRAKAAEAAAAAAAARAASNTSKSAWDPNSNKGQEDDDNDSPMKERMLKLTVGIGMIGFPLLFLVFVCAFLAVGMHIKSNPGQELFNE